MRIGLLHEGKQDKEELIALLEKILSDLGIDTNNWQYVSYPADGSIDLKAYKVGMTKFFEIGDECDLVIVLSDNESEGQCVRVQSIIEDQNFVDGQKIIFVCADVKIESWLISEENSIKHVLGLSGSKPLPYPLEKDDKCRLNTLISDYYRRSGNYELSRGEIRKNIFANLNLMKLYRDVPEVKKLKNSLKYTFTKP